VRAPDVALDQVDGLAHVLDGRARLRVARERREMRDVFDLNGHSTVRFLPSAPTANFTLRILSRE
jgi:hypothetical protein